jgi:hypothetical protein
MSPRRHGDASSQVQSPMAGVLRGMIRDGIPVTQGLKIGDIDPRDDASACFLVSDKALSIGGAALEAIFTGEKIRDKFFCHNASQDKSSYPYLGKTKNDARNCLQAIYPPAPFHPNGEWRAA